MSSSAFNASVSFLRASISSPKSSALSWSFSDAGRAASSFSALSIPALISFGSWSLVLASSAGVVAGVALSTWSLFLNFFSVSLLASAFSLSSANSLRTSPAFKSPDSTAVRISFLPNAFLASSLFVILASASISFSNWSKAFDRASLESASSFLASSSFLVSSLALASASAAFSLAVANSASTAFLASSALVFAASASAASFFSASNLVFASLAAVVVVSTFAWASVTLASAVLASASACLISGLVTSDLGVSAAPDASLFPAGCVSATGCVSAACATAAPVVATPIPTSTDATPTLNLR